MEKSIRKKVYISTFPNVDFRKTKTTKNNYVTEQICLTTNISYNYHKHYNIVIQWLKYPFLFNLEHSVFHAICVFEFASLGKEIECFFFFGGGGGGGYAIYKMYAMSLLI